MKAGLQTKYSKYNFEKLFKEFEIEINDDLKPQILNKFKNVLEEIKKCPDIASATTKAIEVFGAKAGPDLADAIQFKFQYGSTNIVNY